MYRNRIMIMIFVGGLIMQHAENAAGTLNDAVPFFLDTAKSMEKSYWLNAEDGGVGGDDDVEYTLEP